MKRAGEVAHVTDIADKMRKLSAMKSGLPTLEGTWALESFEEDGEHFEQAVCRNKHGVAVAFMHPEDFARWQT